MRKLISRLLTVLIVVTLHATAFAQEPNFTGTWILNMEKSKLASPSPGLTGSIFIITQTGDKMKLTRYHVFGEKKKKISFRMVADGKTRRVKILFKGKLEKQENGLIATLWRKNFLNIVSYKFGSTQNEFIADETFTGYPENYHNVWVIDRQLRK